MEKLMKIGEITKLNQVNFVKVCIVLKAMIFPVVM